MGGRAGGPGAAGRPETGLTANGPLAPGLMHAGPPNFGVGGCGFGVTGVPQGGGQRGPGGHGRARARAGWCQGALAGCMLMVVGSWVPMLRHFILLESNLRDGLYLVRRDTPRIENGSRREDGISRSYWIDLVLWPKHACIVWCTLTLPNTPFASVGDNWPNSAHSVNVICLLGR